MYPTDVLQSFVGQWWVKDTANDRLFSRGRLLWTFIPFIDHHPFILDPERLDSSPTEHSTFLGTLKPLDASRAPALPRLPVAALPSFEKEVRLISRAKHRPALLLCRGGTPVPTELRLGAPRWQINRTLLVAPFAGVDQSGSRGGWSPNFVERIKRCEFSQYLWDKLPVPTKTKESILRLDQLQAIGSATASFTPTAFRLTDEALDFIDQWLAWHFTGNLPEGDLRDIREALLQD